MARQIHGLAFLVGGLLYAIASTSAATDFEWLQKNPGILFPGAKQFGSNEFVDGENNDFGTFKFTGIRAALYSLGYVQLSYSQDIENGIKAFQLTNGFSPNGKLNKEQYDTLIQSARRFAVFKRRLFNPQDLIEFTQSTSISDVIFASRLFAGPSDFPPSDFAAYGILAFRSLASPHNRARYTLICEAYINSIQSFKELGIPKGSQMVTVWPMANSYSAAALATSHTFEPMWASRLCGRAIDNYGLRTAEEAIRHAEKADVDVSGPGPYLLAWSPSSKKGEPDAIVLVADLSDVDNYDQALSYMHSWVRDIERNPGAWKKGWSENLRLALRRTSDKWGPIYFSPFIRDEKP